MDRNEFSNRAFRVTREPGGLRITVPVKPERFRTLLNLVWLLVWAVGEAAIVLFVIGSFGSPGSLPPVSRPLAGLFLAAFTAAGGIVLWRWIWGMGGREIFLVAGGALLVRREIWGVGRSRRFDFGKIRSVRAGRLSYRVIYPSWGRRFIGQDGCEVVILCGKRAYAYGRGLGEDEAGDLVGLLGDEMGFLFPRPLPLQARPAFLT